MNTIRYQLARFFIAVAFKLSPARFSADYEMVIDGQTNHLISVGPTKVKSIGIMYKEKSE